MLSSYYPLHIRTLASNHPVSHSTKHYENKRNTNCNNSVTWLNHNQIITITRAEYLNYSQNGNVEILQRFTNAPAAQRTTYIHWQVKWITFLTWNSIWREISLGEKFMAHQIIWFWKFRPPPPFQVVSFAVASRNIFICMFVLNRMQLHLSLISRKKNRKNFERKQRTSNPLSIAFKLNTFECNIWMKHSNY